jgi:DNA-binding beta-propeller fold protein YncE
VLAGTSRPDGGTGFRPGFRSGFVLRLLFAAGILLPLAGLRAEPDFALERARHAFKVGWTHYQHGAYPLAIEAFHRSIASKPSFSPARVWLGQAYLQSGFPENAVQEWSTAVELGSDDNNLRQKLSFLISSSGVTSPRFNPIADYSPIETYFGHSLRRGGFHKPASIATLGGNLLAVAGFLSRNVLLLDINGDQTTSLAPGFRPFGNPYGVCRGPDGTIYVTDFGRDRVFGFDRRGRKTLQFGESGIDEGKFSGPEGIAVDRQGRIFVVDNGNGRVQKFAADGTFLMSFGRKGRGPDELYRPSGISIDDNGSVYVSDTGNARIQVFDPDGNHSATIGDGVLLEPRGLCLRDDLLVVADGAAGLYFRDLKRGFWWTKSFWNGGEFRFENAIDVEFDPAENTLAVADFGRNSVDILAPSVFRHSDLYVNIRKMYTPQWPDIAAFITVMTRDGRRVPGLTSDNFRVTEDGVPVTFSGLNKTFHEKTSFVFLVERTPAMDRFPLEIRAAAERIVDRRTDRDWFKVVNAGERIWTGLDWSQSRLTILGRTEKDRTTDRTRLGKALYDAVAELQPLPHNKAIVLFTSGVFEPDEAFEEDSTETVLAFAKANAVPVHIVAYTEENRELLERIASETGGSYQYYFADARKLAGLYDAIAGRSSPEYVLVWKTSRGTKKQKWRDVDIRVDVRSQTGRDRSGYFLP